MVPPSAGLLPLPSLLLSLIQQVHGSHKLISPQPQQQGPNLYERTTKLEATLAQFMQVSTLNHKSTESAIKNLEIQVAQLAKHLADKFSSTFGANTEKNLKEECKAVMTRGRRAIIAEDEGRLVDENQELVIKEEKEVNQML